MCYCNVVLFNSLGYTIVYCVLLHSSKSNEENVETSSFRVNSQHSGTFLTPKW